MYPIGGLRAGAGRGKPVSRNRDTVVARRDDQGIPHADRGTPGPFGVAGLDPIGLRLAE
jgi:hypothetical protein